MSKEEALKTARGLVQQAVDIASRAGIDPSYVVAPHCLDAHATQDDVDGVRGSGNPVWCGVPVVIDDETTGLFEMPAHDGDPEQQPAFLVTQATADLVRQEFERYEPSLEIMAKDWQEKKARVLSENKSDDSEE
jgi:hypothetical protein